MIARFLSRATRWSTALAVAVAAGQAQAKIEGLCGSVDLNGQCVLSDNPTFNLIAADGHITAADGVQIYSWGFGVNAGSATAPSGTMQYIGPTLKVKQGDSVTVNLTNLLRTRTSMLFAGQAVAASGGSPGTLTREAARDQTVTYTFTASQPGTYIYQSGTQTALQVEMGLVGALIVYPTGAGVPAGSAATKWAYGDAGSAYERETLVVATEMDHLLHQEVYEQLQTKTASSDICLATSCDFSARLATRFPTYWFMNGRTSPDTMAGNFIAELPLQPYNTLPRLHPGERMLLRVVGAGSDLHPMHHHGNNSWGIARDGRMLTSVGGSGPNLAVSDFTIAAVPGQTYDAIWSWTGAGLGWDIYGATCAAGPVTATNCPFGRYNASGVQTVPPATNPATGQAFVSTQSVLTDMYKPIPAKLPSQFELAYGEFYSGSPYLGGGGALPVGASSLASLSGGFFHMFHSHAEKEIINGGIFPGGMMTMMIVEPLGVTIETGQP